MARMDTVGRGRGCLGVLRNVKRDLKRDLDKVGKGVAEAGSLPGI